jgi:hypothetical protein
VLGNGESATLPILTAVCRPRIHEHAPNSLAPSAR